tara:strand:- start:86 stop:451 length:366 start_codon:yes stop_codon:yes gene_type:complete
MTNRNAATYEVKKAYLSSDFGYDIAVKWFGQEAIDNLPKYTKGKYEGKPMGLVSWCKCVKGGYHPYFFAYTGRIETRKNCVIGKALYQTNWSYNFKTKKSLARNILVTECGDDSVETWGAL